MNINGVQSNTTNQYSASKKVQTKETDYKKASLPTDTYERSAQVEQKVPYEKPKKLTNEQVNALKEKQAEDKANMLSQMMQANTYQQAGSYRKSQSGEDLITKIFGSLDKGLPPLATTKEGALEAISEGGAYSVDAVATRIMDMAKALAGGDASKFDTLKAAVEKGFKQAGLAFEKAANQKLPQISKDTYDEVMKRFETWQQELAR